MTNLAPKLPEYQANIQAKLHVTNEYVGDLLSKITRTTENKAPDLSSSLQTDEPQSRGDRPYSVRVISTPPSPCAGHYRNVRHTARSDGLDRHRDRAWSCSSCPTRGLARSIHPLGRKRRRDGDHSGDRRCRDAGQPISLDAVGAQRHFRRRGRPWAVPDRRAQRPSVGNSGSDVEVYSLHRRLDCRRDADWSVAWPFRRGGLLRSSQWACLPGWSCSSATSWSRGSTARTRACLRWRFWWRPSSGPGCGELSGCFSRRRLTVCLMVIGKYVPQLSFLDILLGNEEVFEPKKRVYQRLLGGGPRRSDRVDRRLSASRCRWSKSTTRC